MLKSKNLVPRNRLLVADAFIIFIFLILLIRFGQIQLFEYKQYKKRADINSIVIGERSNIQDNSVIHLENDQGVIVGNDVTVGHNVILHGCKVGDGVLVGMGAVIMNGVDIGKGSVIAAGAVIKQNMVIPKYSLVVGVPGKIVKEHSIEVYAQNVKWAEKYVKLANIHRQHNQ